VNSQLRLDLNRPATYRTEAFVTSPANAQAVSLVMKDWRGWPGGALALIGPEGSGKTHLARMWVRETGAAVLSSPLGDIAALAHRPVVVENVDLKADEEDLFHLLNLAAAGGAVLLTARSQPKAWPAALPDLRSRFNGLPIAELGPPDDAILTGVLQALFDERNIRPADDLIPYLLLRMERSPAAARQTVSALDEAAAREKREINRTLAVQVLEVDSVTDDLFDTEP
jgi:chromosomal replication initiation ATPase DnaA